MSAPEKSSEEKPKKKSKLPLLLVLVVLLLGGGAGAYFFLLAGGEKKEGEEEVVEKHFEFAGVALEPFYVNLNEQTSFLKAVLHLEYNKTLIEEIELAHAEGKEHGGHGGEHGDESGGEESEEGDGGHGNDGHGDDGHGDAEEEGGGGSGGGEAVAVVPHTITAKMPAIRDAIIAVLSSKKAKDVLTLDGKDLLKEEILEGVNEVLGLDEEIFVRVDFVEFLVQ
jgi:flagellar basal body-associated protein FliL